MTGKVYIAGAGPGDPELLTLKVVRLIRNTDVIFYDRLVNPEVLGYARPGCELLYVGKREGMHTVAQKDINRLLVAYARQGKSVLRLKGGDPFVFGRGGEEALYLADSGIPFEIVPGISSLAAVPAYAGIPVTHRGVASTFAVVTGHDAPGVGKGVDWGSLSGIDTLVFFMGVSNSVEIARELLRIGRPPEELVAFIERGTTSDQRVLTTTLGEVADKKPEVSPPAIFLVGEVIGLREALRWFDLSDEVEVTEDEQGQVVLQTAQGGA